MTRIPPPWHAEARAMRDRGLTNYAIGKALGRHTSSVDRVLRGDGGAHRREQDARRRNEKRERDALAAAKERAAKRPDTLALAKLFLSGEIDRAELSRRLRGEARP